MSARWMFTKTHLNLGLNSIRSALKRKCCTTSHHSTFERLQWCLWCTFSCAQCCTSYATPYAPLATPLQSLCSPCRIFFLLFSHSPASHCIFHFSVILHIKFFSSSSLWYFFLIIICIVIRLVAGKHNASQRGILIEFCRLRGIKKYQFEFNAATLETAWRRLRRTLSSRHRPNPILLFDCAMCLIKAIAIILKWKWHFIKICCACCE